MYPVMYPDRWEFEVGHIYLSFSFIKHAFLHSLKRLSAGRVSMNKCILTLEKTNKLNATQTLFVYPEFLSQSPALLTSPSIRVLWYNKQYNKAVTFRYANREKKLKLVTCHQLHIHKTQELISICNYPRETKQNHPARHKRKALQFKTKLSLHTRTSGTCLFYIKKFHHQKAQLWVLFGDAIRQQLRHVKRSHQESFEKLNPEYLSYHGPSMRWATPLY